jgi:glycosyltransferase involved in cell wall biosynthesis
MSEPTKNTVQRQDAAQPLITVVTVVRNGEETLELTMQSVLAQTWGSIEYLVIDGASADGTLDIVRQYAERAARGEFPHVSFRWMSEPDRGIYDAMNKGIRMATGVWVNFMNAGDRFAGPQAVAAVAGCCRSHPADVYYGDALAVADDGSGMERLLRGTAAPASGRNMPTSHQAMFIRAERLKRVPFDLRYAIAADFDQQLALRRTGCTFRYISQTIAVVRIGGLSYSNPRTYAEKMRIVYRHFPHSPHRWLRFAPLWVTAKLKSMAGQRVVGRLRKWKWRYLPLLIVRTGRKTRSRHVENHEPDAKHALDMSRTMNRTQNTLLDMSRTMNRTQNTLLDMSRTMNRTQNTLLAAARSIN